MNAQSQKRLSAAQRLDDQLDCALCGMLLPHNRQQTILTIGYEGEKVKVCEDSSACRRRAIDIIRAYRKMAV